MKENQEVTIEKTSKKLKLRILIAWCMILGGLFGGVAIDWLALMCGGRFGGVAAVLGILTCVAGIVLLIVTKVMIWWRHG